MIYSTYTDRIKNIVSQNQQRQIINKANKDGSDLADISNNRKQQILEQINFSNKIQLNAGQPLSNILHPTVLQNANIGQHNDFKHLKGTDQTEMHYIVSVFIDIAGSTNLHRGYDLEEIFQITNTIQSAAIHTCLSVGGQIQRLQGDGVFAYFGGKNITKKAATEQALIACSMFTYFVKNDLKEVFLGDEIEDIKTRIGIDFGDDNEVMWATFGLMNVSELTTLSLHTSLASKMQAHANENGIVVGQNIKDLLQSDEDFFDLVRNAAGEVTKRYIYEDKKKGIHYTQYRFEWYRYLKSLPFIGCDRDGNLFLLTKDMQNEVRLNNLRKTASLINSGNAYTNTSGSISEDVTGIKNQPHRFHYE